MVFILANFAFYCIFLRYLFTLYICIENTKTSFTQTFAFDHSHITF